MLNILYISFVDLNNIKSMYQSEEIKFPFFYFEEEKEIYIYYPIDGILYCSEIEKISITLLEYTDVNDFKSKVLGNAIELFKKPRESVDLSISQV